MVLVGDADVKINIQTNDIARQIQSALSKSRPEQMGRDFGKSFSDGVRAGVGEGNPFDSLVQGAQKKGREAGRGFSNGFSDSVKNGLGDLDLSGVLGRKGEEAGHSFGAGVRKGARSGASGTDTDMEGVFSNLSRMAAKAGSNSGSSFGKNLKKNAKREGGTFRNIIAAGEKAGQQAKENAPFASMAQGLISSHIQLGILSTAIPIVASSLIALGQAAISMGAALAQAAPALAAVGGAMGALMQGAMVGKFLMKGVGESVQAIQGYRDSMQKVGKAAALDALQRMQREQQAARGIERAQEALTRAYQDAARSREDAARRVVDAERALDRAQLRAKRAAEDLSSVRKDAKRRLDDYNKSLRDGALDEERAILNVKKAEKELARARAGGNQNAIYEADLAYREQVAALKDIQDRNKRNAADKADVERDTARQIADAQREVVDANLAVADAKFDLGRAREDQVRAEVDAARSIRDATRGVEDALLSARMAALTPSSSESAFDKVLESFQKLSPAAQQFSSYIGNTVMPLMDRLRKTGQEAMFPGLLAAVKMLVENKGLIDTIKSSLVSTGKALGNVAQMFAEAFSNNEVIANIGTIMEANAGFIETLGQAAANLIKPFTQIWVAALPLTEEFVGWIEKLSEKFSAFIDKASKDGSLAEMFQKAGDTAKQIGRILSNLGSGLKGVFKASLPAAQLILDKLEEVSERWKKSFEGDEGASKLKTLEEQFNNSALVAIELGGLVNDIFKTFSQMSGDSGLVTFLKKLREAWQIIAEPMVDSFSAFLPLLGELAVGVAKLLQALMMTGAAETFLSIMVGLVGIVSSFVGLFADMDLFGVPLLRILGIFLGIIAALKTVLSMWGFFKKYLKALEPVFKFLKPLITNLRLFVRVLFMCYPALTAVLGVFTVLIVAISQTYKGLKRLGILDDLIKAFKDFWKSLTSLDFSGMWNAMKKIGKYLLMGFIEGMKMMWESIVRFLSGLFTGLVNLIMGIFGISSPSKVFSYIGEMIVAGLAAGLEALPKMLGKVVQWLSDLLKKIPGYLSKFGGAIASGISSMAQALPGVFAKVWTLVQGALKVLGPLLVKGLKLAFSLYISAWKLYFKVAWTVLKSLPSILWSVLKGLGKVIWEGMKLALKLLGAGLRLLLKVAWTILKNLPSLMWKSFKWLVGALVAGVKAAINAIWFIFVELPAKVRGLLLDGLKSAFNGASQWWSGTVVPWFKGIGPAVSATLGKIWDALPEGLKRVLAKIQFYWVYLQYTIRKYRQFFEDVLEKIWDMLPDGLKKVLLKIEFYWNYLQYKIKFYKYVIEEILSYMWERLVSAFQGAIASIVAKWNTLVAWIATIKAAVTQFLGNAWGALSDKFQSAINSIKEKWANLKVWIAGLKDKVKESLGNLWGALSDKFQSAIDRVKEKWRNLKTWLEDLPSSISKSLSGAWDGLWMSLRQGAWDALNWINKNVLAKIPFGDFKIKIGARPEAKKKYASGGYVSGPGGPRDDRIHAMLSNGEYVIPAHVVRKYGKGTFDALRNGNGVGGFGDWVRNTKDRAIEKVKSSALFRSGVDAGFDELEKLIKQYFGDGQSGVARFGKGLALAMLRKALPLARRAEAEAAGAGSGFVGPAVSGDGKMHRPAMAGTRWAGYPGHTGVDMAASSGTKVKALADGVVARMQVLQGSYGRWVEINHRIGKETFTTRYAHLSSFGKGIKTGGTVKGGQLIALSGNTGNSTGPHLHFEVGGGSTGIALGTKRPMGQSEQVMANWLRRHGLRLAKGGTVMPTLGGVLATIAEAGKPERVVPLDREGRSRFEVQILQMLRESGIGAGPGMDGWSRLVSAIESMPRGDIVNYNKFEITSSGPMDIERLAQQVSREIVRTQTRRT